MRFGKCWKYCEQAFDALGLLYIGDKYGVETAQQSKVLRWWSIWFNMHELGPEFASRVAGFV